MSRLFLLSPANCGGKRAELLFRENAGFELAWRLRDGAVPLGEVFAFISGLYFRGKLAYASTFAQPPEGLPGALVITSDRGLAPPDAPVTLSDLAACAQVPVDLAEPRYREPLVRDVVALAAALPPDCDVVLLGSIATGKYFEVLDEVLDGRLRFPADFVGRGDMSRGALMLQAARAGLELPYVPARGALRRGPRAPGVDTASAIASRAARAAARARLEAERKARARGTRGRREAAP